MPVEYQLRDYHIKPGEIDAWAKEWKAQVYPLRLKFGFKVAGAWKVGDNRFVWILIHEGNKGDFQLKDEEYYGSKERKAIKPDPARHISKAEHWMMVSVLQGPRASHKWDPRGNRSSKSSPGHHTTKPLEKVR